MNRARRTPRFLDHWAGPALCGLLLLTLALAGNGPPRAQLKEREALAALRELRYWCDSNCTRVVLDFDSSVKYEVHRLGEDKSRGLPPRVYIDLFGTRCANSLPQRLKLQDGPVQSIRTAPFREDVGRVVLDLRCPQHEKVYRLAQPDRIVIDVWRTGSKAPSREVPPQGLPAGEEGAWLRPLPLIVIDPGHGGHDPGAVGRGGLQEKDVVFSISRRLKRILAESGKAKAILTRDKDVFLPLENRTDIANNQGADLFVSVHANGSSDRVLSGVETYYLDNTTDAASIRLAALENRTARRNLDDLQLILQDLRLSSNAKASHQLAFLVQRELVSRLQGTCQGVGNLGAKGNLFYVLLGAQMPSILVEVSFVSNPEEEKRLRRPEYLEAAAEGIAGGIENFLERQDYSQMAAGYRRGK